MDYHQISRPKAPSNPRVTAILPCNDLDAAESFFSRLGFARRTGDRERYPEDHAYDYRILVHSNGTDIHLNQAVEGWVVPGKNPFGLYVYVEDVDTLAEEFRAEIIEKGKKAEFKPWGMYEFSVNGPDEVLVRVGWPAGEITKNGGNA
jgi:hypothetical protein